MSDKHSDSRKGLMINSGLFLGAGALLIASFVGDLATGSKLWAFISLGIGAGVGVPHMLQAWKAFSNLEYGETMKKGIISWVAPAGMALINFLT